MAGVLFNRRHMAVLASVIGAALERFAALRSISSAVPAVAVLGNEGGDYDSVIGCICAAWAGNRGFIRVPAVPADAVFLPFVNFPLKELDLRRDVVNALRSSGYDRRLLYSAVDAPEALLQCKWIFLWDHNKLTSRSDDNLTMLHERVVAVIDHHVDEGLYASALPRVVRPAGSCCSLLASQIPRDVILNECDQSTRELLLGAIVLDTSNFAPMINKTTPTDLEMAALLLLRSEAKEEQHVLQAACTLLYERLVEWKNDVSCLTIDQALRRDFKAFTVVMDTTLHSYRVGIASWLEPLETALSRHGVDDFLRGLEEHCRVGHLDAIVVMFAFGQPPNFHREALWLVRDATSRCDLADGLSAYFTEATSAECFEQHSSALLLTAAPLSDCRYGAVHQRNARLSRKQILPALSAALANMTIATSPRPTGDA